MKKQLVITLIITFALMLSFIVKAETYTLTSMEGSMYTELNKRIMTIAYKRIGIDINVETYPAKRALVLSNSGKFDGELFRIANVNKKWKNLLAVPTPIAYLDGMVYSKFVEFEVNGWDSLKPYNIGIKRGILHAERGTQGMSRQIVDTNAQLFQILDKDRVDIIVLAHFNAIKELKINKMTQLKLLKPPVFRNPVYHYVHKKHQEIIPALDEVLQAMSKEGLLKKLTDDYIKELNMSQ